MITREEVAGFLYDPRREDAEKYLRLKFLFETSEDPESVAAGLCSEQSTAQWRLPEGDLDLRPQYAAKVISWRLLSESDQPLYPVPSAKGKKIFRRCEVDIAHPHQNFGPSIPNVLTAVAGEGVFYAPGIHTIQLRDIEFPKSFLRSFEGPQFGLEQIRRDFRIQGRPFFFGVVKPNLGLPPHQFAALAEQAWGGGLDVAKDDEMQADALWSPLLERIRMVGEARRRAEEKTGGKKMFIANVTAEADRVAALAKGAVQNGANAVMVNPVMTGFSTIRQLRRQLTVPIMGHFAGIAAWGRLPYFGVYSAVFTKLMRLAGCDLIGIAGFGERMQMPEAEVLENISACLSPMGSLPTALPIPGGSDWAGTLPQLYARIGHPNFALISGRGVFGHPDGPAAGALSLVQSWEAVSKGVPLEVYAERRRELRRALEKFSK